MSFIVIGFYSNLFIQSDILIFAADCTSSLSHKNALPAIHSNAAHVL